MVDIDELERLRGALENIGNLSLDGCIKVNTPHGLWVGTPDAYAREVLGMPWRAPEGHQRMTDTEIRELRAENARLRDDVRRQTSLAQDHFRNATRLAALAALGEPQ